MISTSPLLLVFKWFNLDYEHKVNETVTLGVSGSYLPLGDFDYSRLTFHTRFYPQGAALTGFYVGVQAGAHRASAKDEHATLTGGGVDLGYAWLFGAERNIGVSFGIGFTRVFGEALEGSAVVLPNVRLIDVGFAF